MDIRKFLKRKQESNEAAISENNSKIQKTLPEVNEPVLAIKTEKENSDKIYFERNDIGNFVQSQNKISEDFKYELLTKHFKPTEKYNFKNDSHGTRNFRYAWLDQYSPWLAYSPKLKGALCVFCVLFPQPVNRGFQGAFITSACRKYQAFNECARTHIASSWHRGSQRDAEHFISVKKDITKEIVCRIDNSVKRTVEDNRKKLVPILSTIIFCGTNDLALRGKR